MSDYIDDKIPLIVYSTHISELFIDDCVIFLEKSIA